MDVDKRNEINSKRKFPYKFISDELDKNDNLKCSEIRIPRIKATTKIGCEQKLDTGINTPALLKAQVIEDDINKLNNIDPSEYEKQYVHNVYSIIAPHFSRTRYSVWRLVELFCLNCVQPGMKFLDCGCGNGKNLAAVKPGIDCIAIDYSAELLEQASEIAKMSAYKLIQDAKIIKSSTLKDVDKAVTDLPGVITPSASFIRGDIMNIPVKSNTFDRCICIAVIHHLTKKERRLQAIKELTRVLKPGGIALIAVWASKQEERDFLDEKKSDSKEGADTLVPWTLHDKDLYEVVDNCPEISSKVVYYKDGPLPKHHGQKRKTREFNEKVKKLIETNPSITLEQAAEKVREEIKINNNINKLTNKESNNCLNIKIKEDSILNIKNEDNPPKNKMNSNNKPDMRVIDRFYHMFNKDELADLVEQVPEASIVTKDNNEEIKNIYDILVEEGQLDKKRKIEVSSKGEFWNRGNWHIFIQKRK